MRNFLIDERVAKLAFEPDFDDFWSSSDSAEEASDVTFIAEAIAGSPLAEAMDATSEASSLVEILAEDVSKAEKDAAKPTTPKTNS